MRGGEGNSLECLAVHGAAGDQAARAFILQSLRCYAGLYRRVGLLLLHRGLLLQLGVADIPEGQIRRHRHPRLPRLSGGHQATAGEARGVGSPPQPTTGQNLLTNLLPTFCFSMASAASSPSLTGRSATVVWSGGSPWSRKGLAQRGWGFRVSSRTYGFPAG